jgi:hypothetical protein
MNRSLAFPVALLLAVLTVSSACIAASAPRIALSVLQQPGRGRTQCLMLSAFILREPSQFALP